MVHIGVDNSGRCQCGPTFGEAPELADLVAFSRRFDVAGNDGGRVNLARGAFQEARQVQAGEQVGIATSPLPVAIVTLAQPMTATEVIGRFATTTS